MRKKLSKEMRNSIFQKTDARCGYCGVSLTDTWQVDHMDAVYMNNDPDNLMASCFSCNNYKHSYPVDYFRRRIERQILLLEKNSVNYRIARRFNLVQPTPHKIEFYFELKIANEERK
jgi:5-methylcytosine-specific restriction endonuclease McrA